MASNKMLSIDITNDSITIVEVTSNGKTRTVHNAMICETPAGSYEDGFIRNKEAVAGAIKNQLSSNGVRVKDSVFVLSSSKVVNREVLIPKVKENKVKDIINANAVEYFPVNVEDYSITHSIVDTLAAENQYRVLVVAAPASMVKGYYDVASMIGLNVKAVDYIGNAMIQVLGSQMMSGTQMAIHLGNESSLVTVVGNGKMLLQRTIPYGTNTVVDTVMRERGVDAATAMTMLQTDRLVTVDFSDNAATESLRHLVSNIGRVIDYYAGKNPDKPIDEVLLTGDGALIRGLDGLLKLQLNLNTRILDNLYGVTFAPMVDMNRCNPVYLVSAIGGTYQPMNFQIAELAKKAKEADGSKVFALFIVLSLIVFSAWSAYAMIQKNNVQDEKDDYEAKIKKVEYIEQVERDWEAAVAKATDAAMMYALTETKNEKLILFIDSLEDMMPKELTITSINSSAESIAIDCSSPDRQVCAKFLMQLKEMGCIKDPYIPSITKSEDEDGNLIHSFSVECFYTDLHTETTAE